MRTIRPATKTPKDQMQVNKPGGAPPAVRPRQLPLVPRGAADGRNYGKQPPQIQPPPGLPGEGI